MENRFEEGNNKSEVKKNLVFEDAPLDFYEKLTEIRFTKNKEIITELSHFDTDGYDEYPKEKFKKFVQENNIDPSKEFDIFLENLVGRDGGFINTEEIYFHKAFRAWLHCDNENALHYVNEKVDFNCRTENEFFVKYKFFNFLAVLIFENKDVDFISDIVREEKEVFSKLKDSIEKQEGSFLLQYLGKDYLEVEKEEKQSVEGDKFDYVPFEIAPGIFAFNKNFGFSLMFKHSLKENGLYVSKKEDYEVIKSILSNIDNSKLPSQETFDKLVTLFSPIQYNVQVAEIDKEIYTKLQKPYHREKIKEESRIPIEQLAIEEQLYFLKFLKFADKEKLQEIRDYYSKFSLQGLRTFLSIEQGGPEMGDKILNITQQLEKDDAQKIFETYSFILDQAYILKNKIDIIFPEKQEISRQVFEALLIKAKDILLSAEYISSQENKTNYTIGDLKNALQGVSLQLEILNDIGIKQTFEYQQVSENNEIKRLLVRDPKTSFEYDLKLLARPFENNKAQARVSMEIGFDTKSPNIKLQEAFRQTTIYKESGQVNSQSSLRFSLDRDTTNKENPFISLDFGNSSFDGQKLSRTGDIFGNSIALVSEYGSHTPQTFSKELAQEEVFAGIISQIQQEIKKI